MKQFQHKLIGASLVVAMLMPSLASADTASITALLEQIKSLQAQMVALQTQQTAAYQSLAVTLNEGASGEDVKALQAMLASDPSIYPEGKISGYYGRMTAQAVKRFQKKHGIEQRGNVGPKTLKKLNELFKDKQKKHEEDNDDDKNENKHESDKSKCNNGLALGHQFAWGWQKTHGDDDNRNCDNNATSTRDITAPAISSLAVGSITTTGATVTWTTNEAATSKVYVSATNPASTSSALTQVGGLVTGHSVALTGLANNTTYYVVVMSADGSGNSSLSSQVSFTTGVADVTAPIISSLSVGSITTTGATVTWTTNEAATSKVYVSATNPASTSSSLTEVAGLVTGHSVALTGLASSTTYYVIVTSTDASANLAVSSQTSFTTATPDMISPIIANVTVTGVATTTGTISWTTNELATGSVYFSTTSPAVVGTSMFVAAGSLLGAQSVALTGLSASTTYYYIVTAKDASNNVATDVQRMFTTTN